MVFLELSVHHGTFGPVRQFSLGEAALEVGRELLCDCCAGDFHKSKLHFLVPQIDGKFLVSGYQFAIVIIVDPGGTGAPTVCMALSPPMRHGKGRGGGGRYVWRSRDSRQGVA